MKRINQIVLTILMVSLLTSCDFIKNSLTYKDKTKDFVETLIKEDYTKCVDQMAMTHEMAENTNIDTMKIGLANFRQLIVNNFGSNIAECALRTGFEKICVIDGDVIEESNLNRQNFTEQQIGTSKAVALYDRLKNINSKADISYIDRYIDQQNVPDLAGYHAGINALDFKNEAPQLFDKLCKEKDIPVLHPYNVGWGGLVTVLSPNGPSLQSLDKNRHFSEVYAVEYAAGYKRYWNAPQVWLEEIIKLYKEETVNLPPPQLAIGSWFVAAMCTHILVKIATGKPYKKYPQFYLSSLFEESSPETADLK